MLWRYNVAAKREEIQSFEASVIPQSGRENGQNGETGRRENKQSREAK